MKQAGDVTEERCRFVGLDVDIYEYGDTNYTENYEEVTKEACTDIKYSDKSCVKTVETLYVFIEFLYLFLENPKNRFISLFYLKLKNAQNGVCTKSYQKPFIS